MARQRRVQKKEEADDNSERIHVCSICEQRFKRTEHCLRHERAHAKVKPYNCRFCERSYGRKDLVVRHEKTLHEDEWKKAQALMQKNTAYSDGLPLSRRKRGSSSVSRRDEYTSPVSPPEISHPDRIVSGVSPHFANQTATSSSLLYESSFSRKPLIAQANCVYSYPLTPGTQETNIHYPRETCITDSALSSVSHIPPEQYYVEEQYLHQYSHHKPEQSADTYREPNSMPIDPNLFESPNTKPRLPAWPSASGCLEILSIWPDINALQGSLKYHRTYSNGLGRATLYRHAQARQAVDGDISSCLRSLSSLTQPPTSTMIIDDEVMEFLLPNTTPNVHLHGTGNIPDVRLLQRSLDQFFLHFNSLIPIIHPQTFEIKGTLAPLTLAMCSIGAYQLSDRELALKLIHIANERLEHSRSENPASTSSPSRHICELQCQVLLIYVCSILGDASTASMAIERIGIFHKEFPPLKAWLVSNREQRSSGSWKAWIEYETSKRLLFSMFIMSSLLTTIYDIAPCISTAQVLGLELPSADALWEAPDERQWFALQNSTTAQLPRLELKDVITPLTGSRGIHGMDELHRALGLSNFAITAATHAANIYVWNLRQCIPRSPQSFSGNVNNIIEDELHTICTKQAETSIARCCQLLANRLPEMIEGEGDHKRRPLDKLAVFNGYALLRSSFLGTFATDTTRSIRVALLSADDGVTIQSACKEYAKQPWHRDQFMDNAAIKLFTDMLAPLYVWKGGGRGEPERGMECLLWNVEHSISVFDTVLFFTKWLSNIELRYQRPPNGQLEQEIMDDVNELIGERVDGRIALAASLTEVFASLLADESSSGGTRTHLYKL
ncbi:hypothetical protein EMPG_15457 [Blastomyces silverae]|uniref:C2H2-type domain-containing protein n=1 Tax=Blastomyces silverae TaxID=2060906 RepID=A0A0H1BDB0_9EURO|nr:hypothetical protein EMPG_15457 [Blastomyces silverae]